jgi:hypothetical protein
MSAIHYLLDENVDPLYRRALLHREPALIVWRVGDVGAPGLHALDPQILVWCEDNSFILVTNNRHSMQTHINAHLVRGGHVPGILVLNHDMTVGETVDELVLIWSASHLEEYQDRIVYLPISRNIKYGRPQAE